MKLNQPVVGITATPTGHGYWLAAADGGIFAFGDARFTASIPSVTQRTDVVGITGDGTASGLWLVLNPRPPQCQHICVVNGPTRA